MCDWRHLRTNAVPEALLNAAGLLHVVGSGAGARVAAGGSHAEFMISLSSIARVAGQRRPRHLAVASTQVTASIAIGVV